MSVPIPTLNPSLSGGYTLTEETIALVKQAREAELTRAINLATGLIGYDLHAPAQVVVPVFTPLVNETPRVTGPGVDVHHYKAITNFGWNGVVGVVDENQSPAEVNYTVVNLFNVFQTIGVGNSVSFKAQWRGRMLEGDIKAKRMAELLYALKLVEENWLITMSDYLWAPPIPLVAGSTSGGTLAAGSYQVAVTAVSANGETFATQVPTAVVTTGTTSSIAITIFTVPNATSYNLYVNLNSGGWYKQPVGNISGSLNQPQNSMLGNFQVTLTAYTAGGAGLPAANTAMVAKSTSNNLPLTFNGMLALLYGAGNLAYTGPNAPPTNLFSAAGQNLAGLSNLGINTMQPIVVQPANTATGKLQYSDITGLLLSMWLNARANPDVCWVSATDNITLTNLLANNTNVRYVIDTAQPTSQNQLVLGQRVTKMLNPTTGKMIDIEILPFLPQGTLIFGSRSLPYPIPGFDGPTMKVIENISYYGLDYPPTKQNPQFSFADYVDETLEINFLGGFGVISGIIPG
jgi:hypothetical protein